MMYLANDLVQNSRKKYPEVSKEFGTVMKAVFVHLSALEFDAKTQASINRLVAIWKERQSFEKRVLSDIDQAWENRNNKADVESQPLTKKPKLSAKESDKSHTDEVRDTSEDIIKVLNSLQAVNNDQSDTAKEILSSLPNLTNITQENIVSQEEGQSMLDELNTAEDKLEEQSKLLQEELETRKSLEKMMSSYILYQRKLMEKKKERLKQMKATLTTVEEAKNHYESQMLDAAIVDDELDSIPMPDTK